MGKFSGILFYADYDHTLTDTKSHIPEANLSAIRYFIDQGGRFAVCTGRSPTMSRAFLKHIPCNAPLIHFNGAMAYDAAAAKPVFCHTIDLDPQAAVLQTMARFPTCLVEVQGLEAHYTFTHNPLWLRMGAACGANYQEIAITEIPRPFVKFSIFGPLRDESISQFFTATPEELRYFDEGEAWCRRVFGAACTVDRAAAQIIDLQAKGSSKGLAALEIKRRLSAELLVCAGDAMNDLSMLEAADLPFVPADAVPELQRRFPNVAPCDNGSIAHTIALLDARF